MRGNARTARRPAIEPPWELVPTTDLDALGAWNEVLLYRFAP
jgi:hypothetical protein